MIEFLFPRKKVYHHLELPSHFWFPIQSFKLVREFRFLIQVSHFFLYIIVYEHSHLQFIVHTVVKYLFWRLYLLIITAMINISQRYLVSSNHISIFVFGKLIWFTQSWSYHDFPLYWHPQFLTQFAISIWLPLFTNKVIINCKNLKIYLIFLEIFLWTCRLIKLVFPLGLLLNIIITNLRCEQSLYILVYLRMYEDEGCKGATTT